MRRYIAIASALTLTLSAAAQNLNPTVQVTNAYDGKLMDISKKEIAMNVPDSLLSFDWNFNYSVFDNPYKGAYEFNPYVIEMRPDPAVYDGTRLYLRAGAGYSLHPEALIVWNPNLKGRFGISVYNDFRGYFGNYTDVLAGKVEPNVFQLAKGDAVRASEMSDRLGAVLRYELTKAILSFDTGLDFIRSTAADTASCTNSPLLVSHKAFLNKNILRARSIDPHSTFKYDLSAHFDILSDTYLPLAAMAETGIKETAFGGELLFDYSLTDEYSLRLDTDLDWYRPSPARMPRATLAELVPTFNISLERFHFEAGMRFSKLWRSDSAEPTADMDNPESARSYHKRLLFPHLKLDYELVDDALVFFAGLTGGRKYNSYAGYLSEDHRFAGFSSDLFMTGLSDASVNSFDASIGLSGRIGHRLQYKLDGGFARMFNAPMQGLGSADFLNPFSFWYDMADYDLLYGDISASWLSDRLEVSTDMRLQKAEFHTLGYPASLPAFSGTGLIRYNWNKRVYAAVSAEWATKRHIDGLIADFGPEALHSQDFAAGSAEYHIPGWVDLGVSLEYKTGSRLSVWAKGGNLLNQMVLRDLVVAERGPYFSVGISVTL